MKTYKMSSTQPQTMVWVYTDVGLLATAPRLSKEFIAHSLGTPNVEAHPKCFIDSMPYNSEHT